MCATIAALRTPKDLEGKRVGIPEWAQTAGIYARGFLSETAGVDLRKIQWVQAGMNEAGREEKVEFKLPDGIQYQQRRDTSISAMLLSGEVDAAISARVPDAFEKGGGKIARLYPGISRRGDALSRSDRHLSDHACDCDAACACSNAIRGWR